MNNREYLKSMKTEVLIFKILTVLTSLTGVIYLFSHEPYKRYLLLVFLILFGFFLTISIFILSWKSIGNYIYGGFSSKEYAALELSLILNPDNEVLQEELDQENVEIIHKFKFNPGGKDLHSVFVGKDSEGNLYKSERSVFYDPSYGVKSGYTSWELISPELYDHYVKNYTELPLF